MIPAVPIRFLNARYVGLGGPDISLRYLTADENRPGMSSVEAERLRVTYFGRSPLRWWWPAVRWACHVNQTALIFGGSRRVGEANWLRRILPTRHAHAFENMSDVCSGWRWCLSQEIEGHRAGP